MSLEILVFDSGVGGLSICKEILAHNPGVKIRYLMDNAFFPYGVQSDDVLTQRIVELCDQYSHNAN